jgi:hypothetical protein
LVAVVDALTGYINAGTGLTGSYAPMFMRITRA